MLLLLELINKDESLYIDIFDKKNLALDKKDLVLDKKNPASINKAIEMLSKNKDIKMPNIRHIYYEIKYITSSWLKSKI